MTCIYNFSSGPAVLPKSVLHQAAEELVNWHGTGMSVMEMSHRGEEFAGIAKEAELLLREILAIPQNYKVLFMQGGAIAQMALVPLNLFGDKASADYIDTGEWSQKAIKEALKYGKVNVAASGQGNQYTCIPPRCEWKLDPSSAYVHICSNETIRGVEYQSTPVVDGVPLVADMSSNILSRPVDVSKYGLIYAGAQKNIGPAGLTVVIVRDDLLRGSHVHTPSVFDYLSVAENGSMYNTPPTYAIYVAGLVFRWIKNQGGLAAMEVHNRAKAAVLYNYLDATSFYVCSVEDGARSLMNISFRIKDERLSDLFLEGAKEKGLIGLKGHRLVGGMRASIYNAMPVEGVEALVAYMREFEYQHTSLAAI